MSRPKFGILSFDISSVSTGWCYNVRSNIKAFGKIEYKSSMPIPLRLSDFYSQVDSIIKKYKPLHIIIEDTYLKNVKTLKVLMQFLGVAVAASVSRTGISPIILSPNTIRSAYSLKSKEEVFDYIVQEFSFKLFEFDKDNDITDAILQALYYYEFVLTKKGEKNGK